LTFTMALGVLSGTTVPTGTLPKTLALALGLA
jgi:hypothetical protein